MTPNEGEVQMLTAVLANEPLILGLFENDYTPLSSSVGANFVPATFAGYSAITLSAGSWTVTAGAPTSAAYAPQSFTSSGLQSKQVFGYFLHGATSGKVYQAERFASAPLAIANTGDKVVVTPVITFGSTASD